MSERIAIFMTFSTYGTHLHGSEKGSVSRACAIWGARTISERPALSAYERTHMEEEPFLLDEADRLATRDAIVSACELRGWHLFCVHARTNHVHLLVKATGDVDRALAYIKSRASVALKPRYTRRQHFWTRHGSTRHIWNDRSFSAAMKYILEEQGAPMAIYRNADL